MRFSFIVTSFDIASYIGPCLESLRGCVAPGDEVIVIDDGSRDGTPAVIAAFLAAGGYGPQVALRPMMLGINTPGGVGMPANIGLAEATGDAVFFVDGDDWMLPPGFLAARAAYEATRPDILIANYAEHDEKAGARRKPADAARWADLAATTGPEARRALALSLIAVPWRKIYARAFLERHRIRFPEGDHFFEDNPFHWDVCLKAESIGFLDRVLCLHRINRPGQTMASTGAELMAFFTHYETIRAKLAPDDAAGQTAALVWLVNNMSWHVTRLAPAAQGPYALRAAGVLGGTDPGLWASGIAPVFAGTTILAVADLLRRGDVGAVLVLWSAEATRRSLSDLGSRLRGVEAKLVAETAALQALAGDVAGLRLIAEFAALKALRGGLEDAGAESPGG